MRKIPLGLLIGAGLALCFQSTEPANAGWHASDGHWYVHQKRVAIQLMGQTCCDPTVTFYDVKWGGVKVNGTHFPCAHPHAIIGGAEPTPFDSRNVHKGRVYILGCGIVHRVKLRD